MKPFLYGITIGLVGALVLIGVETGAVVAATALYLALGYMLMVFGFMAAGAGLFAAIKEKRDINIEVIKSMPKPPMPPKKQDPPTP